jgi:uncharacterized membrane protein YhfC
MRYLLYSLSVFLMLAMPLALATWLGRSYRTNWGFFGVGVVAFVGSQVFHIPFNLFVENQGWLPDAGAGLLQLLIVSAFLGLSAGFFEESARYIAYRWWARDARRWADAMMMGAGHGGIESILLGLILALNVATIAGLSAGRFAAFVPADQWAIVEMQVELMTAGPLLLTILPAVERAFALVLHLSLSLLVMQVFVRGQRRWWWLAVGWHALVNAGVVFSLAAAAAAGASVTASALLAEVVLGLMTLVSLLIIIRLRPSTAPDARPAPPPEPVPVSLTPPPLSDEKLDDSRYL